MIFNYYGKIDLRKIKKLTKLTKLRILDFGCGMGIWSKEDLKENFVKKIILYDKNKKLQKKLSTKYKEKKVSVVFNLKKILKKSDFNLVIISSVIQYMSLNELKKLLQEITKNFHKKKFVFYIIIMDIPKFPRLIEFALLPIFNFKRFFFAIKYFINEEYKKLEYYLHKESEFLFLKKNFDIKKFKNLRGLRFLRYTLILKLKKYS